MHHLKQTYSSSNSRLEDIKRDKAIHNTLEKNRRAHLKECFERLQNELPQYKDKKVTNLLILNYTLKYVEQSKRKERENEFDKQRLLKQQQQLKVTLKNLLSELEAEEGFDLKAWLAANNLPSNTADIIGATSSSSSTSSNSSDSILNVDNDSMDKNDYMDDSFSKNENNGDDESAASTSTASGK
jgi:SOS-response transcriptional repressor LexA